MTLAVCYVEGAGDKLAMESLLRSLIELKRAQGVAIEFFETPAGDRKKSVLLKGPEKALNILRNNPKAQVALVPDLYPRNRGFPHETVAELRAGVFELARRVLDRKQLPAQLLERLHVFCFKHDLEALVLAAEMPLAARLGVRQLVPTWVLPVEDQNHEFPPKRIVEQLFEQRHRRYKETVDAPAILEGASYADIAGRCSQSFAPFVEWLESL